MNRPSETGGVIVGQVEKAHLRRGGFQEVDYCKFFNGIVKWSAELADADRVVDIMSRAIHVACRGTPGPVVIAVPEDVLPQPVRLALPAS